MTLQEAAKLLELSIDASPSQVDESLQRIRERLQEKIDADAGESYKKKHRDALEKAVAAAELLKLANEVNTSDSAPAAAAEPVRKPAAVAPAPRLAPAPAAPAPAASSGGGGRVVAIAAVVVAIGGGAALLLKNRGASEAPAPGSAAPAVAAAPEPAAPAAPAIDSAKLEAARERWAALEAALATADRTRSEMEKGLLTPPDRPAPEVAELRARIRAQEAFIAWGAAFVKESPVPAYLERLPVAVPAEIAPLSAELAAALDRAETELAARKTALLALGRPVQVVSEPAGLRYSLTDAYGRIHEGTTPATVEAPWGSAKVVVSSPAPADWPDWTGELSVDRERSAEARAVFAGAPLQISSHPAGLPYELIRADGSVQRGLTPEEFPRARVGPATVRVTRPGWPAQEQALEIAAGKTNAVLLEFTPGSLTLQSTPPGAAVSAGGVEIGVTPLTLAELAPGAHAYTLTLKGHVPAQVSAEVRAKETTLSATTLAPSHELEKGQPYVVQDLGLELRAIPAGSFLMGSTRLDPSHNSDEIQHEVVLTRDFWLGKYEVTHAEWNAVMGLPAPAAAEQRLPVTGISWEDAANFCRRLTELERVANRLPAGHEYTLPTEAQWEYACRAGNTGLYGGVGALGDLGWFQANSGGRVQPVGQKKANAWGLYDMHGNVWEWCADWFEFYPREKAVDPVGPQSGSGRVHRGGGAGSAASACRSAGRLHSAPKDSTTNLGFRLALSPVAPAAR